MNVKLKIGIPGTWMDSSSWCGWSAASLSGHQLQAKPVDPAKVDRGVWAQELWRDAARFLHRFPDKLGRRRDRAHQPADLAGKRVGGRAPGALPPLNGRPARIHRVGRRRRHGGPHLLKLGRRGRQRAGLKRKPRRPVPIVDALIAVE